MKRKLFPVAALARELGLPSEKISRDNDNQIVYCYDRFQETLPAAESKAFAAAHSGWTKK